MKTGLLLAGLFCIWVQCGLAQDKIAISGTPIPKQLLEQNYGSMPKGVAGYDINICNISEQRQTLVSSQVYQALSQANTSFTPIGRQIMLASILQNQSKSLLTILGVSLNSATGVVALLSTSNSMNLPDSFKTAVGLSAILLGQVTNQLKPVLAPDKVEKFDREVLEPALVLDGGSCVERTVFALAKDRKARAEAVQFRMK
jgi:hypothetical protein